MCSVVNRAQPSSVLIEVFMILHWQQLNCCASPSNWIPGAVKLKRFTPANLYSLQQSRKPIGNYLLFFTCSYFCFFHFSSFSLLFKVDSNSFLKTVYHRPLEAQLNKALKSTFTAILLQYYHMPLIIICLFCN